mmetsp:Transcript_14261/g.20875  ORF Transcript_14261/g.20875 Transcript_14261/m.20875 type:complete len:525 (+) Transcript_14261:161-1735(+)
MRLGSPIFKSANWLQLQRLFSSKAASSSTVPVVKEAPFPLRLVYTYRSPDVVLRRNGAKNKETSPWIPLGLLLGTNAGVFAAWNFTPLDQDSDALLEADTYLGTLEWEPEHTSSADAHHDFMTQHFTATVDNLVNGRLHTLITAGFSHSDFWHLGGNMFALVLFGYRSCAALGPLPFIGLYLAGSFAASSAHIMTNLYQGKTAPPLTAAEIRCAMRNTLREVEDEMRPRISWGLPFIGSQPTKAASSASSYSMTQSLALNDQRQSNQNKDNSDNDHEGDYELDIFEEIGRFMAEVGMGLISFVSDEEASSDNNGEIDENEGGDREHSINSEGQKGTRANDEEINRRLDELWREEKRDGSDIREILHKNHPKKPWLQRTVEARNRKKQEAAEMEHQRQAAVMELTEMIVNRRYVSWQDTPSLGASGAVMAIANGSVLLFPLDKVVRSGVNLSLPTSAALYTYSDISGFLYPDPTDNVDHAGHLAGAGTGLFYVWFRWFSLARAGAAFSGVRGALPLVAHWKKLHS